MSEQQALDIVSGKAKTTTKPLKEFSFGAQVLVGRYGEYIKYNGKNYRMPKGKDHTNLTEEEAKKATEK
jgi:topoisomerase IA-like protein